MADYSVVIKHTSRELTAKERVAIKDTTNALSLDTLTAPVQVPAVDPATVEPGAPIPMTTKPAAPVIIDPDYYVTLAVHNEKAKDKDYEKFVIVDNAGTKYVTGSTSFMRNFVDIMEEMEGTDEPFAIEIYRMPSKNYQGKEFLTCSIV